MDSDSTLKSNDDGLLTGTPASLGGVSPDNTIDDKERDLQGDLAALLCVACCFNPFGLLIVACLIVLAYPQTTKDVIMSVSIYNGTS